MLPVPESLALLAGRELPDGRKMVVVLATSELTVTVSVEVVGCVSVDAACEGVVLEMLTTAMRPLSWMAVPAVDFR